MFSLSGASEQAIELPLDFQERMAGLLGDEYPAFLAALGRPALHALRANTLKGDLPHVAALLDLSLEPLSWCPEAALLPADAHLGRHSLHAAGLFYLQEPSATAVVPVLDPQPGERVLDLCAAPGGKATHVAARLQGQGLLWANDVDARRARVLLAHLERFGVRNAIVSAERPERLAAQLAGFFDRVLVDAPCSGEALFRREPESVREWSPAAIRGCARRQGHILAAAARLVRPGGVLVYTTCTFAPEEDEGVVGHFLDAHPDFALEQVPAHHGFSPGRPEWAPGGPAGLAHTVRLWPHRAPGEGHFVAFLRRDSRSPRPLRAGGQGRRSAGRGGRGERRGLSVQPSPAALAAYGAFCRETLREALAVERLAVHGDRLLAVPAGLPDVAGLRLLRAGWLLGELRGQRFFPSHALAMGLAAAEVREALDFPVSSEETAAYLRGETLPVPGVAGWLLVSVAGCPLGWGKRVGGVVKNHCGAPGRDVRAEDNG